MNTAILPFELAIIKGLVTLVLKICISIIFGLHSHSSYLSGYVYCSYTFQEYTDSQINKPIMLTNTNKNEAPLNKYI